MKLILPHRKANLDSSLPVEEKKIVIENLLKEKIEFHSETMTLEDYLTLTWKKENSMRIMDMIGYYLTKEEKNLDIISRDKEKEMNRGHYRGEKRYTSYSNLSTENKEKLGLESVV